MRQPSRPGQGGPMQTRWLPRPRLQHLQETPLCFDRCSWGWTHGLVHLRAAESQERDCSGQQRAQAPPGSSRQAWGLLPKVGNQQKDHFRWTLGLEEHSV